MDLLGKFNVNISVEQKNLRAVFRVELKNAVRSSRYECTQVVNDLCVPWPTSANTYRATWHERGILSLNT